jgi:hypothetical protein
MTAVSHGTWAKRMAEVRAALRCDFQRRPGGSARPAGAGRGGGGGASAAGGWQNGLDPTNGARSKLAGEFCEGPHPRTRHLAHQTNKQRAPSKS